MQMHCGSFLLVKALQKRLGQVLSKKTPKRCPFLLIPKGSEDITWNYWICTHTQNLLQVSCKRLVKMTAGALEGLQRADLLLWSHPARLSKPLTTPVLRADKGSDLGLALYDSPPFRTELWSLWGQPSMEQGLRGAAGSQRFSKFQLDKASSKPAWMQHWFCFEWELNLSLWP